jgi:WD40 repeat protein
VDHSVAAHRADGLQIQTLALSPNGKILAVGIAQDGSIRLVSPTNGDLLKTLYPAHTRWPQVLSFSPDGRVLASAGDDGQILLWNVATGRQIKTLYQGDYPIWGMSFSPDGKYLLAGFDTEETFRVWDTSTWELKQTFPGDLANDLAFSPDGKKFATAGGGIHEANIWDFTTGELLFNLSGLQGWVWAIAYDPNGKYVASGGIGDEVVLWDVATGRRARDLVTGSDLIETLAFSPDGTRLASGGSEIIVWNLDLP